MRYTEQEFEAWLDASERSTNSASACSGLDIQVRLKLACARDKAFDDAFVGTGGDITNEVCPVCGCTTECDMGAHVEAFAVRTGMRGRDDGD